MPMTGNHRSRPTAALPRALLALGLLLPALTVAAPPLPEPTRISEHAWAWIGPYGPPTQENQGFRMNLGFVAGSEAVAVIDSGYGDPIARAMLEQIRELSDRPVRFVVNTNSQPHRVLGNATFREAGAEILAAEAAAPRIAADGAAMAGAAEATLGLEPGSIRPPGAPDRLTAEPTDIDLGGVTLRLIPVGAAHTEGSLVAQVVEDGVVFAGDVLYGGRLLAVLPVSRVDSWISAFETLRGLGDARFVPGHGEIGGLTDFEHPTYAYLTALREHMDAAVDEGADLQEAIGSFDQSPWQGLADFEALSGRNAHQTYLEREAAAFE